MEKSIGNTCLKARTQKKSTLAMIILIGFTLFLCVNLVSADWDFNNIKKDIIIDKDTSQYGKIEIDDWYGLKNLMSLELKENTEQCLSTGCSATQEIIMYENGILIDDIRFLDMATGLETKIESYEIYVNGDLYNGEELTGRSAGVKYNVEIKGEVYPYQIVDWQIKSAGLDWIDEWAVWTSALNTDLTAYWKLNETTGNIAEDIVGNFDLLTNATAPNPNWTIGLINNGLSFNQQSGEQDGLLWNDTILNENQTDLSFSMWVKFDKVFDVTRPEPNGLFDKTYVLNKNNLYCYFNNANGLLTCGVSGGGAAFGTMASTTSSWTAGNWYHIAIRWSNSTENLTMWVNASLEDSLAVTAPLDIVDGIENPLSFGNLAGSGVGSYALQNATLDEIGIWQRDLTDAEIVQLYNSGSGIAVDYGKTPVYLISPIDNYNTTSKNIAFSCNATASGGLNISNISLYHNESGTWEVNQTNSTTRKSNSTTSFNIEFQDYESIKWNCYACNNNSVCDWGTNRTLNLKRVITKSETYVTPTTSGSINEFLLELETNGTQVTIGYLNYNNTNFLGSISSSGNYFNITRNQTAVGVSSSTNIPFFWNITLEDGYNFIIDSKNQTVNPIVINETCGAGMYTIFNFTLVDEITQKKLNGATNLTFIKVDLDLYTLDRENLVGEFYHEYNLINPSAICIDKNLSQGEQYSTDIQVQYGAANYSSEYYNIERYVLTSDTLYNNITLYDLDNANTQNFRLIARDTSYLPIDGALIQIERKYIENGSFYITEIPKADVKGITSASLQLNDVIYNFYIYQAGVLISSFTNQLAICQTPLVSSCEIDFNDFNTGISGDFEEGEDFEFTLNYNDTSKVITSQFVIPSGEPSAIYLEVIREDTLGTAVCSDIITSASGTLSCIVPTSFGNSTVMAKIYKDSIEQGKGSIKTDQNPSDIFGVVLIMMSVLVMMTLIGIGVSDSPVITGAFIFIGLILMVSMNLVKNTGFIGATATILFFLIAMILVIIKAARRS